MKILMMNKEDFDNWRECNNFKTAIENNGYSYSIELENELIDLMKKQGCISLVFHVFKLVP